MHTSRQTIKTHYSITLKVGDEVDISTGSSFNLQHIGILSKTEDGCGIYCFDHKKVPTSNFAEEKTSTFLRNLKSGHETSFYFKGEGKNRGNFAFSPHRLSSAKNPRDIHRFQ